MKHGITQIKKTRNQLRIYFRIKRESGIETFKESHAYGCLKSTNKDDALAMQGVIDSKNDTMNILEAQFILFSAILNYLT